MPDRSHKWFLGFALLAMLVDTALPHDKSETRHEYQYKGLIPPRNVLGFASERQWLFAHRKFRNQCVLEALAAEEKQPGHHETGAPVQLNGNITFADLRQLNND